MMIVPLQDMSKNDRLFRAIKNIKFLNEEIKNKTILRTTTLTKKQLKK